MNRPRTAAIVTVGTELVHGLAVDTNTAEIARVLQGVRIDVLESVSVGDDETVLSSALKRCTESYDLVVVTGGLGPTHDDVTREAAAHALGLGIHRDRSIEDGLRSSASRHVDPRAGERALRQADVIDGATVLPAVCGTAPGQWIGTARGMLALLPGPPREMRPLLSLLVEPWTEAETPPVVLRCVGMSESDVQMAVQDVLGDAHDVQLTVLARPGDVQAVLFDRGIGAEGLARTAISAAERIGDACYSRDGQDLAQVVLDRARLAKMTLATAESCTGGLLGGALTAVPGASDSYAGGIVSYSDEAKISLLGVEPSLIETFGAVSDVVAKAMAAGARHALGTDLAVSITGVAGPGGGTAEKPVGTVWFGVSSDSGTMAEIRRFSGDRRAVRERAVATALDLMRRALPR